MLISYTWHLLCRVPICQTELLQINLFIKEILKMNMTNNLKGVWIVTEIH